MNVALEPEVEKVVEEQVESGAYSSADELLNTAVRRLLAIGKPRAEPPDDQPDTPESEFFRDAPLHAEWLRLHRSEHKGEWVALYRGRLIANGKDHGEVYKSALAQGAKIPLMERIPEQDELPFGGW